jgi:photosystem II stability/assembly factor-like uncharacterized protein
VIAVVVIGLLVWFIPKLPLPATPATPAANVSSPATTIPTNASIPTATTVPTPTSIPLTWKRISLGQEFSRDTITAIVVDFKDPDIIYIGMQTAGIFKSIDGGDSWAPAQEGMSNAQIMALVINPQDSNTLLAATQGGVFVTNNEGKSWTQASDRIGKFLLIDPKNGSHLYLGDGTSVFESNDMGSSWTQTSDRSQNCPSSWNGYYHNLAMDPNNSNTLFTTAGGPTEAQGGCPGVYRSTDSGHSWTRLGLAAAGAFVVAQDPGGNSVYLTDAAGGSDLRLAGLAVSNNQGGWDIRQHYYCAILTTNPQNPTSAYCGIDQGGLNRISLPFGGVLSSGLSTERVTAIHVDTYDGQDRIIAGVDKNGLFISKDGGKSWSHQIGGIGSSYLDLSEQPDGTKLYLNIKYDNTRCALYKSDDSGRNWKTILNIVNNIFNIDEKNQDNDQNSGFSICYPAIDADNNQYTTQDKALMQSKNGGDTWGFLSSPNLTDTPWATRWVSANPHISGLLYFQTDQDPYLYYSLDLGQSWGKSVGASGHDDQAGNATLFFDDSGNTVYREWQWSSDAGKTWRGCGPWKFTRNAYSDSFLAIDPRNSKHIIIATIEGIHISTDGCQTWVRSDTGLESLFMNSVAFDSKNPDIVYAGTDGGAYVSFDSGKSWNQIDDGLLDATVVYSIVVDKNSNVYAATPYGIFKLASIQ